MTSAPSPAARRRVLGLDYTGQVTQPTPLDSQLERWFSDVRRQTRRHGIIDRTLRDDRSGLMTIPLRVFFKTLEIGPVATAKMAFAVIATRLGWR
jgi:hypothetical protein